MKYGFSNLISDLGNFIKLNKNRSIDVSRYNFIEAVGMAILKSIELDENINITNNGKTQDYMEVMFNYPYDKSKNYIPVEVVNYGDIEKYVARLTETIMKHPSFTSLNDEDKKDLRDYIYYMVGEILNNAMHHSLSPIGAVISGQVYPQLGKIQICVIDRGIGFLKNLERKYSVKTETEAVRKALDRGITSPPNIYRPYSSSTDHAGYGLYILKEIITNTKGELKIISNDGAIYLRSNGQIEEKNLETAWKGSIVVFEFYEKNIEFSLQEFLNAFIFLKEKEEFSEGEDIFI